MRFDPQYIRTLITQAQKLLNEEGTDDAAREALARCLNTVRQDRRVLEKMLAEKHTATTEQSP